MHIFKLLDFNICHIHISRMDVNDSSKPRPYKITLTFVMMISKFSLDKILKIRSNLE